MSKNKALRVFLIVLPVIFLSLMSVQGCVYQDNQPVSDDIGSRSGENEIEPSLEADTDSTRPVMQGHIMIANVGDFEFDPDTIETVRKDIFKPGHFSVFDILVYLDGVGDIDMQYHFDEGLNTYIIDSINDREYWWNISYYAGGWPERNVFRMDHYPYKDGMYISIIEQNKAELDNVYEVFRQEMSRLEGNSGNVIIPEVFIQGPNNGNLVFEDVEVTAHDIRDDIFKKGIITAIDVILSLGDRNEISYVLKWYESISPTADIVKNYWVEAINDDIAYDRCGFVYESGSYKYEGFTGNHIHIPADIRIIQSPEYVKFFWICI